MSEDSQNRPMSFNTRKTLISQITSDCEISWQEFHYIYERFVCSIMRRFGVAERDIDDEAQKVFLELHRDLKKEETPNFRERSFGSWFGQKAKWRALQYHRAKGRKEEATDPEAMPETVCEAKLEQIWDREWAKKRLQLAMTRVKASPRNIQIFHALAVEESTIEEVCADFEISRSNADTIKKRVKDQLAIVLSEIEDGDL
jgi:RNA polymerase sigma factor (sigma-70 family)